MNSVFVVAINLEKDDSTVRQLVALHDAQFVLTREQGFASWTKLKAYADQGVRLTTQSTVCGKLSGMGLTSVCARDIN
jgi:hypothetical protein